MATEYHKLDLLPMLIHLFISQFPVKQQRSHNHPTLPDHQLSFVSCSFHQPQTAITTKLLASKLTAKQCPRKRTFRAYINRR